MEQMAKTAQPGHRAQRVAVDEPSCRKLSKIIVFLKGPFEGSELLSQQ